MGQSQCWPAAVCEGVQRELHNGNVSLGMLDRLFGFTMKLWPRA